MRGSRAHAVLVVDDNAQNRALAQATLEDAGYDVVLAESGEQGITLFQESHPDCILLDVRMPGMDGPETCTLIRALPDGRETPIVFLTAQRDVRTFDAALDAGGDDYLTKPIQPAELVLRVRAAVELRQTTRELREQYELVQAQRTSMTRLELQKEQLTAFVVHDLKNPVSSLDLHAQLLLRDKTLSERARGSVQHIRDEARALTRLIANLLYISRSEEGRLVAEVEEIDLEALVAAVVEELELRAQNHGVRLKSEIGLSRVRADEGLLRRVLENLVDNAIRHSPEGTEVIVFARSGEGRAEIRVQDSGPGVPPESRSRIFERFYQVESGPSPVRGAQGLGLAFAKLAVEAHGGEIEILDGSPGAVFSVRLPHDN